MFPVNGGMSHNLRAEIFLIGECNEVSMLQSASLPVHKDTQLLLFLLINGMVGDKHRNIRGLL